jgi:rSAM/selenodomain-associated transferase 2
MRVDQQPAAEETKFVSVIVPTWNEAANLPACIRSVGAGRPGVELFVADGGSTDRTMAIAADLGARIVLSPVQQRATQLNLAVQHARGDVLLFLHADTILPLGWLESLKTALDARPAIIGGAFRRRFDSDSMWLRATCTLADFRGSLLGWNLGDQAMFVRASEFWKLSGFRPIPTCEDLDFSIRLAKAGRTRLLRPTVVSSCRRFQARGPFIQTWIDFRHAVRFLVSGAASQADMEPKLAPEAEARQPDAGLRFAQSGVHVEAPPKRRIHPHIPPFPS